MTHTKEQDNDLNLNPNPHYHTAAVKEAWAIRMGKIEGEPLTMLEEKILEDVIEKTGVVRLIVELGKAIKHEMTGAIRTDIGTMMSRLKELGFRPVGPGMLELQPWSTFDLIASHDIKWAQQSKPQSPLKNSHSVNRSRKSQTKAAANV